MSGRFFVGEESRSNRPLLGRGDRVLVTGAGGFLGSHLCQRLIQCGTEVHAVSRTLEGLPSENPRWWRVDLEDHAATKNLFESVKPHVVFHLSGQATGDADIRQVLPTFHSQLLSTVHLLTVSSEIGCRRITLTGSLAEPQAGQVDSPPSSPYAASKWASSAFARMFHCLYQAPVVIVRPFMVYGPNQNPNKVIPYSIRSLLRGDQLWALTSRPGEEVRAADLEHTRRVLDWQPKLSV